MLEFQMIKFVPDDIRYPNANSMSNIKNILSFGFELTFKL